MNAHLLGGDERGHPPVSARSRREFLGKVALSAVALAGSAGTIAGASSLVDSGWRCRLSTSTIHFKRLSIEQACERIAQAGFEAIDIWSAYENCQHLDDALTRLGPKGLSALLERHRLKLFAFSCYVGGYAKYAELLGKTGGGVAIQGSAAPCPASELNAKMKAFLESLKPLAELAEKHNSCLAIENHGDALLNTLDSFKAFTDLNQSPRVGVALAPYHLQAIGASIDETIRISGKQLFFFYAWQKQPETNQLPGYGPTDFAPWLKALAGVNYRGYVNPFMHGDAEPDAMSDALKRARSYLEKCAAS
jgi:sugar phosphate isomerase/epimerase